MNARYSQEFKLHVIRTYLGSPYGIRTIAKQFNLPSKNYISNWIVALKKENIFSSTDIVGLFVQRSISLSILLLTLVNTAKSSNVRFLSCRILLMFLLIVSLVEIICTSKNTIANYILYSG